MQFGDSPDRVEATQDMDLEAKGTFVQEYIQNPFLVDGKYVGLFLDTSTTH